MTRYGFSKKTYEGVTGVEESFEKYEQSVSLLKQFNISFKENAVLLKENESELDEFLENANIIETYISVNNDNPYAYSHRPSDETLRQYYRKKYYSLNIGAYEDKNIDDYVCNCGMCSLTVNSSGDINPCTNFYYSLGNIGEVSLKKIWCSPKKAELSENCRLKYFKQCMECSNKKYISSIAPCNNYAETKNINTVSKEMCRYCSIIKSISEEINYGNTD